MAQAPKLEGQLRFYWTAFTDLGTERTSGMGAGPIPKSQMRAYAHEELELSPRETEAFLYIIRKADIHYMNVQSDKAARKTKK